MVTLTFCHFGVNFKQETTFVYSVYARGVFRFTANDRIDIVIRPEKSAYVYRNHSSFFVFLRIKQFLRSNFHVASLRGTALVMTG